MNHQVFERTWHSSEYACFSVITPSPKARAFNAVVNGPHGALGGARRKSQSVRASAPHVARSATAQTASLFIPSLPHHPFRGGCAALPARLAGARPSLTRRPRPAADRGTARCGRRARLLAGDSTTPVYARPLLLNRSRPHQQSGGQQGEISLFDQGGRRAPPRARLAPEANNTKSVL